MLENIASTETVSTEWLLQQILSGSANALGALLVAALVAVLTRPRQAGLLAASMADSLLVAQAAVAFPLSIYAAMTTEMEWADRLIRAAVLGIYPCIIVGLVFGFSHIAEERQSLRGLMFCRMVRCIAGFYSVALLMRGISLAVSGQPLSVLGYTWVFLTLNSVVVMAAAITAAVSFPVVALLLMLLSLDGKDVASAQSDRGSSDLSR